MSKRSTPGWLHELCTRRPWTVEDAHRVLDELEASGESVGAFAARVGLVAQRLYWWRDRLTAKRRRRREGAPATIGLAELIPVPVRSGSAPALVQGAPVEVIAGGSGGVRVMVNDLSPGAAVWVAAMLRALGEGEATP